MIKAISFSLISDPGLEVIKLEYSLRINCKQPIISLYFESENELKFYNLEAWITACISYELTICKVR